MIRLTDQERILAWRLVRHAACSTDELVIAIWGYEGADHVFFVVSKLRKKLAGSGAEILTKYGWGYSASNREKLRQLLIDELVSSSIISRAVVTVASGVIASCVDTNGQPRSIRKLPASMSV
jgi:hypothetical protein